MFSAGLYLLQKATRKLRMETGWGLYVRLKCFTFSPVSPRHCGDSLATQQQYGSWLRLGFMKGWKLEI